MADYPYTMVPRKIGTFLSHIQKAAIPPKVTVKYMRQSGFTSSNDSAMIPILKFIDFIDTSGTPSKRWHAYRDRNQASAILAEAVKEAYSELFDVHPDANRKDNEALLNFFSTQCKVGARALGAMVSTFRSLCELSDFEASASLPTGKVGSKMAKSISQVQTTSPQTLTVNVNIQLQLPATEDTSIYDKIFEALKKHLLS